MMMSPITAAFERIRLEQRPGLITYVTAGDPNLRRSADILRALDRAGADLIEVGIPFSDPLADGPVIQRACERAIAAGTSLDGVLRMLSATTPSLRAPTVLFSYANPIFRMGFDVFAARAAAAGVAGVLALDIPPEESGPLRLALTATRLDPIYLLSPTTTLERIRLAGQLGRGFLYAISRTGVTGSNETVAAGVPDLVRRIRSVSDLPVAVGFGLSRPEHVRADAEFADAAVVGSALVSVIASAGDSPELVPRIEQHVGWLLGSGHTGGLRTRSGGDTLQVEEGGRGCCDA
jgi:tryptophan synthase alpha chain